MSARHVAPAPLDNARRLQPGRERQRPWVTSRRHAFGLSVRRALHSAHRPSKARTAGRRRQTIYATRSPVASLRDVMQMTLHAHSSCCAQSDLPFQKRSTIARASTGFTEDAQGGRARARVSLPGINDFDGPSSTHWSGQDGRRCERSRTSEGPRRRSFRAARHVSQQECFGLRRGGEGRT